uniref:Uncharacterized protein n=1 Tax=Arundo donax TaxID=35708 RepID=A0A0A9H1B9_ARUDO
MGRWGQLWWPKQPGMGGESKPSLRPSPAKCWRRADGVARVPAETDDGGEFWRDSDEFDSRENEVSEWWGRWKIKKCYRSPCRD